MTDDLIKATRLVPCSVVLLSAGVKDNQDVMTATAMFVAEKVPLLAISVSKNSTTYELIEETGECALNIASTSQVDLVKKVGATHGRDVDKMKTFGIQTEAASKIAAPLITGACAGLECKVVTSMPVSNYMVYLVQVVACSVNDKAVPMAWHRDKYFGLEKAAG